MLGKPANSEFHGIMYVPDEQDSVVRAFTNHEQKRSIKVKLHAVQFFRRSCHLVMSA